MFDLRILRHNFLSKETRLAKIASLDTVLRKASGE
jgi:hypothetical protein